MAVKVTNNYALEVVQDSETFFPTAEEIFAVIYENKGTIRGVKVSKKEFLETGLTFSREAADPVILVEKMPGLSGNAVS